MSGNCLFTLAAASKTLASSPFSIFTSLCAKNKTKITLLKRKVGSESRDETKMSSLLLSKSYFRKHWIFLYNEQYKKGISLFFIFFVFKKIFQNINIFFCKKLLFITHFLETSKSSLQFLLAKVAQKNANIFVHDNALLSCVWGRENSPSENSPPLKGIFQWGGSFWSEFPVNMWEETVTSHELLKCSRQPTLYTVSSRVGYTSLRVLFARFWILYFFMVRKHQQNLRNFNSSKLGNSKVDSTEVTKTTLRAWKSATASVRNIRHVLVIEESQSPPWRQQHQWLKQQQWRQQHQWWQQ